MFTDIITDSLPTGCPVASPQIILQRYTVLEILISRNDAFICIYLLYVLRIVLFHALLSFNPFLVRLPDPALVLDCSICTAAT